MSCRGAASHVRQLTLYLTHMRLPGLTSTDQMRVLAVADTLAHFSTSAIDKLAGLGECPRAPHSAAPSVSTARHVESVDDCGLRYLIALKQHEYLLRCLPGMQRVQLHKDGLPTSTIIWALHRCVSECACIAVTRTANSSPRCPA